MREEQDGQRNTSNDTVDMYKASKFVRFLMCRTLLGLLKTQGIWSSYQGFRDIAWIHFLNMKCPSYITLWTTSEAHLALVNPYHS
jgi:hypothetical protein